MVGRMKKLKDELQQRSTFYKLSVMNTIYPDKKKEKSIAVKKSASSSAVKTSSIATAFKLSQPNSSKPQDINMNLKKGSAGTFSSRSASAVASPSDGNL